MYVPHALRRAGTVAGLAAAGTLVFGAAASAHVTVSSETPAAPGAFSRLAFSVPAEEPKADTTKLVVNVPTDHPLAFATVRPVAGWTAKVTTTKLPKPVNGIDEAVSRITWTGGRIKPGEFQLFEVNAGPLPTGTRSLAFTTEQTYSNGKVVKWNEPPKPNGQEVEHPAPALTLTPTASASPAAAQAPSGSGSGDTTARVLAGAALVVAVIAAVLAFARRRTGAAS